MKELLWPSVGPMENVDAKWAVKVMDLGGKLLPVDVCPLHVQQGAEKM